jgi:hypothetical protein
VASDGVRALHRAESLPQPYSGSHGHGGPGQ